MNIEDKTCMILAECIDTYNAHPLCLTKYIGFPELDFSMRGHCAGKANMKKIWLNLDMMRDKRYPNALKDTATHEMAHTIAMTIHGSEIKAHGIEWSLTMHMLGANPERCHSYITKTARKTRKFEYACHCTKNHRLGIVAHNKAQKSTTAYYRCKQCKQDLKFKGEIK